MKMKKLITYIKMLSVFSALTLGGVFLGSGGEIRWGKGDVINERPLPVPEPSSYILVIVGGITILCFRCWNARKKNSENLQ